MKNTHSHSRGSLPGCGSHDRSIQPRDAVAARNIRARRLAQTIVICLAALCGSTSDAGLVITFEESGSNVTATLSGSFATLPTPNNTANAFVQNRVAPSAPYFDAHTSTTNTSVRMNLYEWDTGNFPDFGTGNTSNADATTANTSLLVNFSQIYLDENYALGTPITGVLTWNNQSFSTMELTPGAYSQTLSNGEAVTLNVVPEPASYVATLGVGAACWIAVRRRRRSP